MPTSSPVSLRIRNLNGLWQQNRLNKHVSNISKFNPTSFSACHKGLTVGWLRGTALERQSVTGELSLSCTRPKADGWVNHLL